MQRTKRWCRTNSKKNLDPREYIKIKLIYCQFKINRNPNTEPDEIKELDQLETDVINYYKEQKHYLYNNKKFFPFPYHK